MLVLEVLVDVRVGDIPATGVEVALSMSEPWVARTVEEAVGVEPDRLSGRLRAEPPDEGGIVDVAVSLVFEFPTDCARCGEPTTEVIDHSLSLRYSRGDSKPSQRHEDEEIELKEDDLDVGWYRAGTLSLADALSEAVALALPMRSTCEDTAGCDARTAELLRGSAEQAGGHPGFAALKNWT